jgi:hypothetical protein
VGGLLLIHTEAAMKKHGHSDKDAERPAPIEKASAGQANADMAADAAPGNVRQGEDMRERQEQLLDEAVQETYPASDPISPKRVN